MFTDRNLLILVVILLIVFCIIVFGGHFNCSAHAQTLEVTPSTQPATVVDGVVVQQPPAIRVTAMPKDKWGVTDIVIGLAAILGVVSLVLVPALNKILRDMGEIRATAAKAFSKAESQEERINRQGETQKEILLKLPPPPPGGV